MASSEPAQIAHHLAEQRVRLAEAARASGRDPASVRLIAVSKRQDVSKITAAYDAGQRDFGENYVQELVKKAVELAHLDGIRWHMIGHLQSNKAKYVAPLVHAVHTVSSLKLVSELASRVAQRRAQQGCADARLSVLVEVNVSAEASKSGCSEAEVPELLDAIDAEPSLVLSGLMTVPPQNEDPNAARPFFERLAALRDRSGGPVRLPELSMGMSNDAETAVACGATWVRIGTAIFGERTP